MFDWLYAVSSLAFVLGIAAYWVFCVYLSEDIKSGRIQVKTDA